MITYLRTLPFYKAFNSRLKCLNEFNRLINPLVNYNKYVVQQMPYQTLFNVS